MTASHLPVLNIPTGSRFESIGPVFYHSTDGTPGSPTTNAHLLVENGFLTVGFECLDNFYSRRNTFTEHNTDLWRQEVFEVFIAAGEDVPGQYIELEINPNNALFAAWVDNYSGTHPEKLTMLEHEAHGIRHSVTVENDKWSGQMVIPLSLLGKDDSEVYRLNFYRIVLREDPGTHNWECNPENCDFLCWSPTLSGAEPAFHRPAYFGTLRVTS